MKKTLMVLVMCCIATLQVGAFADEWPSLFRGVTVGEGPPGVTVVFVKEEAFAAAAGLHAGDHIVAVGDQPVRTLDDFAIASRALAGKHTAVDITVLRSDTRFVTEISLESATVKTAWGLAFLPDYSLHFVDAKAARRYWSRRAAQELIASKDVDAMRSLLNVLHYAPDAYDEALALCEAVQHQGRRLWQQGQRAEAAGVLRQAVELYRRAAAKTLSLQQWTRLKRGLQQLSETLKQSPSTNRSATAAAGATSRVP